MTFRRRLVRQGIRQVRRPPVSLRSAQPHVPAVWPHPNPRKPFPFSPNNASTRPYNSASDHATAKPNHIYCTFAREIPTRDSLLRGSATPRPPRPAHIAALLHLLPPAVSTLLRRPPLPTGPACPPCILAPAPTVRTAVALHAPCYCPHRGCDFHLLLFLRANDEGPPLLPHAAAQSPWKSLVHDSDRCGRGRRRCRCGARRYVFCH